MSVDRSLHLKSSLERHRNVLTRAERVAWLVEQDRWGERQSAMGLPKIGHRKGKAGRKRSAKAEGEGAAAAPGAAAATTAPAGQQPGAK